VFEVAIIAACSTSTSTLKLIKVHVSFQQLHAPGCSSQYSSIEGNTIYDHQLHSMLSCISACIKHEAAHIIVQRDVCSIVQAQRNWHIRS